MLKNIVFLNKLKWFCHEMFLAYQECFKYETLSTEVHMRIALFINVFMMK